MTQKKQKIYVDAETSDYIFKALAPFYQMPKNKTMLEIAEELIQSGEVSDEYTAEDLVNEFYDRL